MKGLRALDFSVTRSGRFASFLLRALGAEVIQIDDLARNGGARPTAGHHADDVDPNAIRVAVDLDRPEGRELAAMLAARSDVVLDDRPPDAMDCLGPGLEALRKPMPEQVLLRLLMDSAAADGTDPGLPQASGDRHSAGGWGPADASVGVVGVISALAALIRRKRSGRGALVDLRARDAFVWTLGHELLARQCPHDVGPRRAEDDPRLSPNGVFATMDREWVAVTVNADSEWAALCTSIGADEAFARLGASRSDRAVHRTEIEDRVAQWSGRMRSNAAVEALQAAGVAAFNVYPAVAAPADTHPVVPWGSAGAERLLPHSGLSGDAARSYVFRGLLGFSEDRIADLHRRLVVG